MLDAGLDVADSEDAFSHEMDVGTLLLGEVAYVDVGDGFGRE